MRADELESYGESFREAAGQGNGRKAGYVHRKGANVDQVHLHRVVNLFTQAKGHDRRRGGDQGVHLLKHPVEVAADQGPGLLGLQVIGIVIPGGQGVGAEHDPAFDLLAKAVMAGLLHRLPHIVGVLVRVAVFDPVVPCQVGGTLGGREDVVAGQRVPRAGQGDGLDRCPQGFQRADRCLHRFPHSVLHPIHKVFLRDAKADRPFLRGVCQRPCRQISHQVVGIVRFGP